MVAVPGATDDTSAVLVLMLAIPALDVDQVPPFDVLARVELPPLHTAVVPVMAAGVVLIVTSAVE